MENIGQRIWGGGGGEWERKGGGEGKPTNKPTKTKL